MCLALIDLYLTSLALPNFQPIMYNINVYLIIVYFMVNVWQYLNIFKLIQICSYEVNEKFFTQFYFKIIVFISCSQILD